MFKLKFTKEAVYRQMIPVTVKIECRHESM